MPQNHQTEEPADLLSDQRKLTLEDICDACNMTPEQLAAYVEEGIIEPDGADIVKWQFSEVTLITLRRAQRLERDLRLNLPGIALALELMQRIEELETRLTRYQRGERGPASED